MDYFFSVRLVMDGDIGEADRGEIRLVNFIEREHKLELRPLLLATREAGKVLRLADRHNAGTQRTKERHSALALEHGRREFREVESMVEALPLKIADRGKAPRIERRGDDPLALGRAPEFASSRPLGNG